MSLGSHKGRQARK